MDQAKKEVILRVAKEIVGSKLVVFSKSTCGFCREAKEILTDMLGMNASAMRVVELDLIDNGSDIQQVLRMMTGIATVPNIFIGGKSVGGCSELKELKGKGVLHRLLCEASLQPLKPGDKIPNVQVQVLRSSKDGKLVAEQVESLKLFEGKTSVLFGVPAAYSPSCSERHLPSYIQHFDELKSKGVDQVFCISVNDAFVMKAWASSHDMDKRISFIADGNGELIEKMGLAQDSRKAGMGMRSRRFACIVRDGVVEYMAIDKPMQTDISLADRMIPHLSKL
ncbi:hypothetical protein GUITHDRAFT_101448 [Guillardia theta CCMP2712]|uniref:Thioredoxin domain-containing protein n=2 Tax=Guillardia theta TaxID=55529 RepID=L1JXQ8_GUITC|nr:hypothetical protein GUITHDRAFT_101448 [Guillardia theta CCMP2712]EKX53000.1 hypothetical protein GUITHDRAFT_101448 [Guillardia theta CCMP2712]|eukprot:XP_005839980.1 hypothetical protein GUITHDRAFT_101448 [Guillardia theta CCMP2712]